MGVGTDARLQEEEEHTSVHTDMPQDRLQHKARRLPRKFQLPSPGQNTTTIVERVETGLVSGQDSLNIRETFPSFCFPFMNPRNPKLVNIF